MQRGMSLYDAGMRTRLTSTSVPTGEEEEEVMHQVRGKLYVLSENQWKERGTGQLRLNVRQADGGGARLRKLSDGCATSC